MRLVTLIAIPILILALYWAAYVKFADRITPFSEGAWKIWYPLLMLERGYESQKREPLFSGAWISTDGRKLEITFGSDPEYVVRSPDIPEFEFAGDWYVPMTPSLIRFKHAQISSQVTETESLSLFSDGKNLKVFRANNSGWSDQRSFFSLDFTRVEAGNESEGE